MRNSQLKARLYLCCLLVLAVGFCSALLVYFNAEEVPVGAVSYVVVDGVSYPIAPQHSKLFIRSLEQFGGKASVLFDEFNRWFDALWRGRNLALTIACISTAAALAVFLFASWLPADRE
jgi:hypothetical protein